MKKLVSLFLSLVMTFTLLGAVTITGNAETSYSRVLAGPSYTAFITDDGKLLAMGGFIIENTQIHDYSLDNFTDLDYSNVYGLADDSLGPGFAALMAFTNPSYGYTYRWGAEEIAFRDPHALYDTDLTPDLKQRYTPSDFPDAPPVVEISENGAFGIAICADGSIWTKGGWEVYITPQTDGEGWWWDDLQIDTFSTEWTEHPEVKQAPIDIPGQSLYYQPVSASPFDKTHTMFVSGDGRLAGAGNNEYGQLGNGTNLSSNTPVYAKDYLGDYIYNPKKISCGFGYTLIIKNDDTVWATGNNQYGELGTGPDLTGNQNVFYPVKGPNNIGRLRDFKDVCAGWKHSIAVKNDGSVWAWGHNSVGQLGDNTKTSSNLPVRVKDETGNDWLRNVVDVHANASVSMAVKSDGTVWMWGNNDKGQLGQGHKSNRRLPVQVKGPDGSGYLMNIKEAATAEGCSMALDVNGYVWTWGDNQYGRLGHGNNDAECLYPKMVEEYDGSPLSDIVAISAGYYHNGALKSNGLLFNWGKGTNGQLGIGIFDSNCATVPNNAANTDVLRNITYFSCGREYTVADGYAWGLNQFGQFGNGITGGIYDIPTSTPF